MSYYETHKEQMKTAQQKWRQKGERKELVECECKRFVSKNNLARHLLTKKHINLLLKP